MLDGCTLGAVLGTLVGISEGLDDRTILGCELAFKVGVKLG